MLVFSKKYFIYALLLLIVEVYIALFMHDAVIRPYGGDFLVVIFMYCALKSFLQLPPFIVALPVLIFSYLIEITQYYRLIFKLQLEDSLLAHLILGSTFKWLDLLAYTLGIVAVLVIEEISDAKKNRSRFIFLVYCPKAFEMALLRLRLNFSAWQRIMALLNFAKKIKWCPIAVNPFVI